MLFTTILLLLFKKESRLDFELEIVLFSKKKRMLPDFAANKLQTCIIYYHKKTKRTFMAAKVYDCALP